MERCAFCKAEDTPLYENGVPICLRCADAREIKHKPPQSTDQIHLTLVGVASQEATAKLSAANQKFNEALNRFPGGPAHPDGVQGIRECLRDLTFAREEMIAAHRQLSEFIGRGIVPDDMKRSGVKASRARFRRRKRLFTRRITLKPYKWQFATDNG